MEYDARETKILSRSDSLALREPIHEILRMAEQALLEELTPEVRSYLLQIQASGSELLTVLDHLPAMPTNSAAPPLPSRPEEFTAPNARVLVVDDNEINLAVTEGVLSPLQMQVDLADSGASCIQMVQQKRYDLIFMDHMMPEMDGVEATRWIRRELPGYAKVPTLALTANTDPSAQALFRQAGMNDFVAKPVSFQTLRDKLRQWLPADRLAAEEKPEPEEHADPLPDIRELDLESARSLMGDETLLWAVLEHYYRGIERNCQKLRQLWEARDLQRLTIEVHSLKSTSKQIGAARLSSQAALLEMAGKSGNAGYFQEHLDKFLSDYMALGKVLERYFGEEDSAAPKMRTNAEVLQLLDEMQAALEEFDAVHLDDVLEELDDGSCTGEAANLLARLRTATEECEFETAQEIVAAWKRLCQQQE